MDVHMTVKVLDCAHGVTEWTHVYSDLSGNY